MHEKVINDDTHTQIRPNARLCSFNGENCGSLIFRLSPFTENTRFVGTAMPNTNVINGETIGILRKRIQHIQAMHDRLQVSARNGTDISVGDVPAELVGSWWSSFAFC